MNYGNYLTPHVAATAAQNVYQIRKGENVSNGIEMIEGDLNKEFVFSKSSRFNGQSGDQLIYSESGFGVYGNGINSRQGEAIILIRGTVTALDWVTDANFGYKISDNGHRVHEGFYRTFKSFQSQLSKNLAKGGVSKIHLVGHSLGGALASMTADWLISENIASPVVYTFGAPRVGSMEYANHFTKKVKEENIFRVYNRQDPVSMVPSWPFTHYPMPGNGLYVGNSSIINPFKHKMKHYIDHCENVNWTTLRNKSQFNTISDQMVENWLESGIFCGFDNSFALFHAAINYVINKTFKATGVNALTNLSDSFTALDRLAYSLEQVSKVSKEVSGLVKKLMMRILSALGHQFNVDMNLTVSFIRWVLSSMERAIYNKVAVAINIPN